MPKGTLEVLLLNTQGLQTSDFLYQGKNPQWNEKFVFKISERVSDLVIRIMDKDTFTADDFIGEANIPLDGVFEAGSLPPMVHRVVLGDYTYCGQIKVCLTFSPKIEEKFGNGEEDEDLGGWKAEYL